MCPFHLREEKKTVLKGGSLLFLKMVSITIVVQLLSEFETEQKKNIQLKKSIVSIVQELMFSSDNDSHQVSNESSILLHNYSQQKIKKKCTNQILQKDLIKSELNHKISKILKNSLIELKCARSHANLNEYRKF